MAVYENDFYLTDTQCTQENVDWLWDSLCTIEEAELVLDQTYADRFCPFVDEITRFISRSPVWRDEPKAWAWLESHGRDDYFETFGREASDDEWLTLFRWSYDAALPTATKARLENLTDAELANLETSLKWFESRRRAVEENEYEIPLSLVAAELAIRKKKRVCRVEVIRRVEGHEQSLVWDSTLRERGRAERTFRSWVNEAFGTSDRWPHTFEIRFHDPLTAATTRTDRPGQSLPGVTVRQFAVSIRHEPRVSLGEWADRAYRTTSPPNTDPSSFMDDAWKSQLREFSPEEFRKVWDDLSAPEYDMRQTLLGWASDEHLRVLTRSDLLPLLQLPDGASRLLAIAAYAKVSPDTP